MTLALDEPWRYCAYCDKKFDSPRQFIAHLEKLNSNARYIYEELEDMRG